MIPDEIVSGTRGTTSTLSAAIAYVHHLYDMHCTINWFNSCWRKNHSNSWCLQSYCLELLRMPSIMKYRLVINRVRDLSMLTEKSVWLMIVWSWEMKVLYFSVCFLPFSKSLIHESLRPLSRVVRSQISCTFCICQVVDGLAAATPSLPKLKTIGAVAPSTNDMSRVIGINLIGIYFRWSRIPSNGFHRTVWYATPGILLKY